MKQLKSYLTGLQRLETPNLEKTGECSVSNTLKIVTKHSVSWSQFLCAWLRKLYLAANLRPHHVHLGSCPSFWFHQQYRNKDRLIWDLLTFKSRPQPQRKASCRTSNTDSELGIWRIWRMTVTIIGVILFYLIKSLRDRRGWATLYCLYKLSVFEFPSFPWKGSDYGSTSWPQLHLHQLQLRVQISPCCFNSTTLKLIKLHPIYNILLCLSIAAKLHSTFTCF